jgi:NTE family protein
LRTRLLHAPSPAGTAATGSPQSQSYYDTSPLKKTLERLVDFDRINDLKTRLSVGVVGVTSGNFKYFDNYEFKKAGRRSGRSTSWRPERCLGLSLRRHRGRAHWDGGISSTHRLISCSTRARPRPPDLQVDLFSARGPLTVARGRRARKDIRFSRHLHEHRQEQAIHNARMAVRDLIGKLPELLK